jgi:hypothetical protein
VTLFQPAAALDAYLLSVRRPVRRLVIAATLIVIVSTSLPYVPRQYVDYSRIPLLHRIPQPAAYGPDTIADMYAAKVILNDPADLYSRRMLAQTPLEARTWSKEASAPYPPAVLLAEAGLYALGAWTGIGFYGMILIVAALFLLLSLAYFWNTRWYLFPLLYLNFSYLGYRFVHVQDGSYLVMLLVVIAALLLARARPAITHALMAIAITMKLSPLFYARCVLEMTRRSAIGFVAILIAGLVLPYFIWDDYLYIYRFHEGNKGGPAELAGAVLVTVPFTIVLWYVEKRLDFNWEDRVGWGLVPFALFLGFKMNVARHLVLMLLVPDRRGVRNVAAGVGLGLPALFPSLILVNSSLAISTTVLAAGLGYYLHTIGWTIVLDDLRHPARTGRMMLASAGH